MSDDPISRLIRELGRLPGVGERSATRLAFYIIRASQRGRQKGESLAHDLARALTTAVDEVGLCRTCQNLCAGERCSICNDGRRDTHTLCVVESVQDLRAIETSGAFRGQYFVLHGALSPLDGVGPDELKLPEVVARAQKLAAGEVILATNPDVEGDATALYLARLFAPTGIKLSRLASGVPLGGELEFQDPATLGRALSQRRELTHS
jgi:recombination protein RecR